MHKRLEKVFGCGNEDGQALIETAVTVPLLLVILLGAVEMARVAYAAIEVSNAARAAAQYGAMNGGQYLSTGINGLESTGMLTAAQADAGELGSAVTFTTGYPTMTCACSGSGAPVCTSTPPSGCNPPASQVVVTITVETETTFDPLVYIPLPGWAGAKFKLHGFAQQKVLPL